MNKIKYLGTLIGITTVLVILVMTTTHATASSPIDAGSESGQTERATTTDPIGKWQTVLLEGGRKKCEGLVFESAEDAEAAAIDMGCSGYHEHHKEDGTVLYMPTCKKTEYDRH